MTAKKRRCIQELIYSGTVSRLLGGKSGFLRPRAMKKNRTFTSQIVQTPHKEYIPRIYHDHGGSTRISLLQLSSSFREIHRIRSDKCQPLITEDIGLEHKSPLPHSILLQKATWISKSRLPHRQFPSADEQSNGIDRIRPHNMSHAYPRLACKSVARRLKLSFRGSHINEFVG